MNIAVITGGSQGLGLATAQAFAKKDCEVFILDITPPEKSNLLPSIQFIDCDVTNSAAIKKAFAQMGKQTHNQIHFLVNNAGIQRYGSVSETSEAVWDAVMNVNLKSAFLCSQAAIPLMQATKTKQSCVIINVASAQSYMSQQNVAAYTTSKTALLGLTRSIAVDYAPHIRCLAVCPSTMDTPMLHHALEQSKNPEKILQQCKEMHLLKRIASSEEIADLIVYLCLGEATFMTGQSIRIDGGLGIMIEGSPEE